MTALGIGEVIGGCVIGYVIDKVGSKKSALFNTFITVLMTASVIYSIER